MSRSRNFVAAVALYLLLATFLWMLLRPEAPTVPTSDYKQAEQGPYSPGSPRCYPSRLSQLAESERADERYRCDLAAEEQRSKGDDLVQQTRSADAAVENSSLTYRQTIIALAATLVGLLTLVAAFYAAWYARRAAEETERSAKAAEDTLRHAREFGEIELRAYLAFDEPKLVRESPPVVDPAESRIHYNISYKHKNFGSLPANHVRVKWGVYVQTDPPSITELRKEEWAKIGSIAPGDWFAHEDILSISPADELAMKQGALSVFVMIVVVYKDVFGYGHRLTTTVENDVNMATFSVFDTQPRAE